MFIKIFEPKKNTFLSFIYFKTELLIKYLPFMILEGSINKINTLESKITNLF